MAGAGITFNSKVVENFFKKSAKSIEEIVDRDHDYIVAISIYVYRSIMNAFKKQRGSKEPWPAWNEAYKAHMEKRGYGEKTNMLKVSGRLRDSAQPIEQGKNYRRIPDGVLWYNNAKVGKKNFPYAYAHNTGGPILPQREFMWLDDKNFEKIAKITAAYMVGDKRGKG